MLKICGRSSSLPRRFWSSHNIMKGHDIQHSQMIGYCTGSVWSHRTRGSGLVRTGVWLRSGGVGASIVLNEANQWTQRKVLLNDLALFGSEAMEMLAFISSFHTWFGCVITQYCDIRKRTSMFDGRILWKNLANVYDAMSRNNILLI